MSRKIVIASDSFKGCLTSQEVGNVAAQAISFEAPDYKYFVKCISDGGEGWTEIIVNELSGKFVNVTVEDPLRNLITTRYGVCEDTAVMEVAAACGLALLPHSQRNPLITTSFGVGQMIADALRRGIRKFIIGLGGSATNDAGIGMLSALGFRFFNKDYKEVYPCGKTIGEITLIDDSKLVDGLRDSKFLVSCDVTNPLTGPNGASLIFGPQKGATPEEAIELDKGFINFASVVNKFFNSDLSDVPGAGAAGGLGYAFISFLNASLKPGIEVVLDTIKFDECLKDCNLVITGEGCLDRQTCMGKAPAGVLKRAKAKGIPVIAIGGCVDSSSVDDLLSAGFSAVYPVVSKPCDLSYAMTGDVARENIRRTVRQIIRTLRINWKD